MDISVHRLYVLASSVHGMVLEERCTQLSLTPRFELPACLLLGPHLLLCHGKGRGGGR